MARTISRLLNNIVLRLDRILNKALKIYGLLIVPQLIDVARACFAIGYYLRLGRAIITVILRKEGKADYLLLGSYRPIALKNTLSKILKRVIAEYIVDIAKIYFIIGYYLRLRRAIITVVLRKEGKADYLLLGSYRPIALENTLSKILERIIVEYMVDIAKEHTLLP